jgi:hypothetical protein
MSLAHSAPILDDPTTIPRAVLSLASLTLRRAEGEQATRRLRWRIVGRDDWIGWARQYHSGARDHAAQSLRRIRAAALAEGVAPRILWARARGIE